MIRLHCLQLRLRNNRRAASPSHDPHDTGRGKNLKLLVHPFPDEHVARK